MAVAGGNFGLYYFLLRKRQAKRILGNSEFRLYIALLVGASLLIAFNLIMNMEIPIGEALRYSSFQVVSVMTTTGFVTANFDMWPEFSKVLLLILMAIGAPQVQQEEQ